MEEDLPLLVRPWSTQVDRTGMRRHSNLIASLKEKLSARRQRFPRELQRIEEIMWPVIFRVVRSYAPYITLPFAGLVGIIGYNVEGWVSDKFTPYKKSISEQRRERLEEEALKEKDVSSLKEKKFVPSSVFEKNLSPSLQN